MDVFLLGFAFAGFLAVVLMLEGAYLLWNSYRSAEAKRLQARLRLLSAGERLSAESQLLRDDMRSRLPKFYRWLLALQRLQRLDRMLLQSGLERSLPGLLSWSVTFAIVGLLFGALLPLPWWAAPVCAAALGCLPLARILWARDRRLAAIEQQLPDALDLIRAALQAGHGLVASCGVVAETFADPVAQEFRYLCEEVRLGLPLRDALVNLTQRVNDENLPILVVGTLTAQEVGGNLAEVVDNIAHTIRERAKLQRDIQVMTAQGRLSGLVLTALPFIVGTFMFLRNPTYFGPMVTRRTGQMWLLYGCVSLLAGHIMVRRIVKIQV